MKTKFDYALFVKKHCKVNGLSCRMLAQKAGVSEGRLNLVLRNKAHLTREQAFFVGLALKLSPPEMEKLALMVVLARAKSPKFKKHVLLKLRHIQTMLKTGSWTQYMSSAMQQVAKETRIKK